MYPRISPNKSWEGAIAGFTFALLSAISSKFLVLNFYTLSDVIVIGVIIGIWGQLGDLFESMLKRDVGVKDSSAIIPGHGGILSIDLILLFSLQF